MKAAGETPLIAFSPYGLSKGLTAEVVRHRCREFGMRYGKFVIPNPFGPPRSRASSLTSSGRGRRVRLRGSIPPIMFATMSMSRCSAAYAKFVGEMAVGKGRDKLNPSGYVETQGTFADRVAAAMRARLTMQCRSSSRSRPIFRSRSCASTSSQPRDMSAVGMKARPGIKRRRDIAVETVACARRRKTEFE